MRGGAAALALAANLIACTPPSDPVVLGELCVPRREGECAPSVTLSRGNVQGRNAIDYVVLNLTPQTRTVVVRAGPAALFEEILSEPSQGQTAPSEEQLEALRGSDFYIERVLTLAAGARAEDRLTADELGREGRLWFSIECRSSDAVAPCALRAEYALLIDPLECATREDCLSGWECDVERGRCVECRAGEDSCDPEQICELNRCTPPSQSTCATSPRRAPRGVNPSSLLALAAGAAAWVALRRRRRHHLRS